jgi:hypothetical protein
MKMKNTAGDDGGKNVYSYIRWSTERQNFGDNERRQLQAAESWCAKSGLKLSDRTFTDRGTSAFKGRSRSEGRPGRAVENSPARRTFLIEDYRDHLDKPKWFVEESDLNVRAGRAF